MRQLRLVFARRDGMAKVLVAATLLPLAGSCGGKSDDPDSNPGAGASANQGGAATSTSGGSVNSSGGTSGSGVGGDLAAGGSSDACPAYMEQMSYVVPITTGGTIAEMAQFCAWDGSFALTTPAAWVHLIEDATDPLKATGTIAFSSEVLVNAGYLTVTSVSVAGAVVSKPVAVGNQFQFDLTWDTAYQPSQGTSRAFLITVVTACAPEVSSVREHPLPVFLVRCGSPDSPIWVSGGETCTICAPMAEMVAQLMPAPANASDSLPLPGHLELGIRSVARDGRYLVLITDKPEAADGLTLTWQSSAGELLLVADDVAVWTLPDEPGPHQVQVAAEAGDSAGIALYLHRDDGCQPT